MLRSWNQRLRIPDDDDAHFHFLYVDGSSVPINPNETHTATLGVAWTFDHFAFPMKLLWCCAFYFTGGRLLSIVLDGGLSSSVVTALFSSSTESRVGSGRLLGEVCSYRYSTGAIPPGDGWTKTKYCMIYQTYPRDACSNLVSSPFLFPFLSTTRRRLRFLCPLGGMSMLTRSTLRFSMPLLLCWMGFGCFSPNFRLTIPAR